MKFNTSSSALYSKLQAVSKVVPAKSSIPILEYIYFNVNSERLQLIGSDKENTIITRVDVSDVEGEGIFALKSKTIIESIREISEQPIHFDINQETLEVHVTYQNGEFNLVAADASVYPMPADDEYKATLNLNSSVVLDGITRCIYAAASDEIRPVMNGVFFDITDKSITFVASDGKKLVKDYNTHVSGNGEDSLILPKKPALLLKSILGKEEDLLVLSFSDKFAKIELPEYTIYCSLLEGRFPNYNSVIPNDNPYTATVDRMAVISALKRMLVFASQSNHLLKLSFDNNLLTLSAQDVEFGTNAQEKIMCGYDSNPISIGFDGDALLESFNNLYGDEIIVKLADPSRAGVFVPAQQEEGEELLILLMPMMVND